jgi:hypothetical protein
LHERISSHEMRVKTRAAQNICKKYGIWRSYVKNPEIIKIKEKKNYVRENSYNTTLILRGNFMVRGILIHWKPSWWPHLAILWVSCFSLVQDMAPLEVNSRRGSLLREVITVNVVRCFQLNTF